MPSVSPVCSPRVGNDVEALNNACYKEVKESRSSESPTESTASTPTHTTSPNSDTSPGTSRSPGSTPSPNISNSSSESPTFRERLRSARKLIPQYPRRARLQALSTSDCDEISKDETALAKQKTQRSDDFRSFFREHYIFTEFKSLCANHESGVYVMPSSNSSQVWHGIIFLRAGPYRDGIFRFFIFLSDDFPESRPLVKFTTPVFHPQIHQNGVLNLDIAFPTWRKEKHSIWQIIKFMKNCFYNADTWGATNLDAMNVMHNSLEEFMKKAEDCSLQSQLLYDKEMQSEYSVDDGNYLRVKKMSEKEFEEGKKRIEQMKFLSSRSYPSH